MQNDIARTLTERATVPVEEAVKILGLSRSSIYAAIRNGSVPSIRVGGRVLILAAPLRRMLGLNEEAA